MTNEEAFAKLLKYCTYQERCHDEVRKKLLTLKVFGNDLEQIMSRLIEHDFLNEERFAKAYAGGKFRQMHWGKTKIIYQLKFRHVSDYCIKEAIKEIDDEDYLQCLHDEIEKRRKQVNDAANPLQKIAQHIIGKGFEPDLVWKVLKLDAQF
jgi:regulatory protein